MPDGYGYPIGPGAGPGVGVGGMPNAKVPFMEGLQAKMGTPMVKGIGASIFLDWLLNKTLQGVHGRGMRKIQKASLRSQAEMVTPESLYYQAALPQAQQEESMALQALTAQLTGGVLGPTLARGERMIGG